VRSYPHAVGPWGGHDLVGNAAEWTATIVPHGRLDRRHVLFGGSYLDAPRPDLLWRRATRGLPFDDTRRPDVGFRVARDVPPLP
jgi:formylglycine-generating enzyme required for sulfatase activity